MTQTTFTDDVVIQGSQDIAQLQVQANSTQTQPLQNWQDHSGNALAQLTGDGKFQIGDPGLVATPTALVEANETVALPSSKPQLGLHSIGKISGAISSAITWVYQELRLLGTGGLSGLHVAHHSQITIDSSTTSPTSAELRAGDFVAANAAGASGSAVGKATGSRSTASNAASAYLTTAVGVEGAISNDTNGNVTQASAFSAVVPANNGPITTFTAFNMAALPAPMSGSIGTVYGVLLPDLTQGGTANYALYTGKGIAHLGDVLETPVLSSMPTSTPPTNFVQLYTKLLSGTPQLYAKNSSGVEYLVGGGVGAPTTAKYLLQVADASLPNAQAMGALTTGLVKNTTITGVQSIAAAGSDYSSPTGTENLSNKTITASTINSSVIGATAPSTGTFTTLTANTALVTPIIAPISDSTAAIQITKADKSTNVVDIDTTNIRVGINTASPATTLDVAAGANGGLRVRGATAMSTYLGQVADTGDFQWRANVNLGTGIDDTTKPQWVVRLSPAQDDFAIFRSPAGSSVNFTQLLKLNNSGNMGINTTIPAAQLEVDANAAATKGLIVRAAASQTANLQEWQGSNSTVLASISGTGALSASSGTITNFTSSNVAISGGAINSTPIGAATPAAITGTAIVSNTTLQVGSLPTSGDYGYTTAAFYTTTDAIQAVEIARGGVVNPQTLLFGVNHTSLYSSIQAVQPNVSYNTLAINPLGGNVGIGSTNAPTRFDIFNASALNGAIMSIRSDFTAIGKWAAIRFGDQSQTTAYQKGAIIYEGIDVSARGRFHVALNNTSDAASVTLTDQQLTVEIAGVTVHNGWFKPPQATTAGAPAYVKGGMYFDTTLNKLRIGGATAWETVTSS
ncbi:MAG: hypothetical protein ACYDEO_12525 [Aggregatilineales bacterium]